MVNQNLKVRRQCKQAKKLYELAIRLEFGFLEVAPPDLLVAKGRH
ncbi:hypothetical protein BDA96_04G324500 [Sorghum bicolor]|uniref:Uncharacterized protein n=2 Tax=Sorghum bicolor TaxID=4558 RepID=A0A1Z5RQ24_SORBI|nr:hypothetical protein BDA96_04G324500 [Sorghum bicolor]OQU85767.1 hypothetical protein SORBI_3004G303550 [Sorghum bicolor]